MGYNVAIDGPAGAGKSTIAKELAKELSFIYVDTGAMYRGIALFMIRKEIDPKNESVVTAAVPKADVTIKYEGGVQKIILNGEDVSSLIRTEEVSIAASTTSAFKAVRAKLLDLQRELAEKNDVIMDGRDIGTTILPNADVKVYLTASVETRAKRRYDELVAKGETHDIKKIEEDIRLRDEQDMTREISPLKKAKDAVEIDSSDMTIEEVVSAIKELIKRD